MTSTVQSGSGPTGGEAGGDTEDGCAHEGSDNISGGSGGSGSSRCESGATQSGATGAVDSSTE